MVGQNILDLEVQYNLYIQKKLKQEVRLKKEK